MAHKNTKQLIYDTIVFKNYLKNSKTAYIFVLKQWLFVILHSNESCMLDQDLKGMAMDVVVQKDDIFIKSFDKNKFGK